MMRFVPHCVDVTKCLAIAYHNQKSGLNVLKEVLRPKRRLATPT